MQPTQPIPNADNLRGDEGNDQIVGDAAFDDINGNMGDDWVVGCKDQDLLKGEDGDDIVYGNIGADWCEAARAQTSSAAGRTTAACRRG